MFIWLPFNITCVCFTLSEKEKYGFTSLSTLLWDLAMRRQKNMCFLPVVKNFLSAFDVQNFDVVLFLPIFFFLNKQS